MILVRTKPTESFPRGFGHGRRIRRVVLNLVVLLVAGFLGEIARAQPGDAEQSRFLTRGRHQRVALEGNLERLAVGDEQVLSVEVLNSREILLLGLQSGTTSLILWYENGQIESESISVRPDLSLLEGALRDIHSSLSVDIAPDRDAFVLRGLVPDLAYSLAAEETASNYLRAGGRRRNRSRGSSVRGSQEAAGEEDAATETGETNEGTASDAPFSNPQGGDQVAVINLIQLLELPPPMEERLQEALRSVEGGTGIVVKRVQKDSIPSDETDVFLLEGSVANQVVLVRILNLASRFFGASNDNDSNIEVVADEGGSLTGRRGGGGSAGRNRGSAGRQGGLSGSLGGGLGGGGGQGLSNNVNSNPGRAKAVSVAQGRVLSFLTVEDLPQVRVNARIFEVNRTRLLNYAPDFQFIYADFNQPGLRPGTQLGTDDQDVRNIVNLVAGGLSEQLQVSGGRVAIDSALDLLEARGLARSLSAPALTVLSGEVANFIVGGEVPIPESFSPAFGSQENTGVFSSVAFRPFGVQLSIQPRVGEDDRITLNVNSSVSRPDAQLTTFIRDSTGGDPGSTAFSTRSLSTSTRLDDGQALLLGGLVTRASNDDASYTPGLHRLPLIGWLFKSFAISSDDLELVMVVNPVIVREPLAEVALWEFPDPGEWLFVDAAGRPLNETDPEAEEDPSETE